MHTQESAYTLIDTHCHISHMLEKHESKDFTENEIQIAEKILAQAATKNVTSCIEVGTTKNDSLLAIALAKKHRRIHPVIGIHPHEAHAYDQETIPFLKKLLHEHNHLVVGIGECGLDKHYPHYDLNAQIDLFIGQIELALEYDKALVVHTRDAEDETYAILERYKHDLKRVTIHCYSNSLAFAQEITAWGWVLGIGGTVTYPKNHVLRHIVKTIGLNFLVLETDAPFLPPQIIRGKQNSPQYISNIAEYIAQLLEISVQDVAQTTTHNAKKLFKLYDY